MAADSGWYAQVTMTASAGAGFMTYAMLTSPAAGKPPDPHRPDRDSRRSATVGSDADGRYSYTNGDTELYGLLGIEGTTYQIGFDTVAKLLGDVSGKTFLDFGCGTGRSARS